MTSLLHEQAGDDHRFGDPFVGRSRQRIEPKAEHSATVLQPALAWLLVSRQTLPPGGDYA
jgi:hypothetical protein